MPGKPSKAIIIGAGIAGPVVALLLKRHGVDAEVFEAWPRSSGTGGGLQIAPNGMRVLAAAGLASKVIHRGSVAASFEFFSESGVRLGAINRDMERRFGHPAVNLRRGVLNEVILRAAESDGVRVNWEKRLVGIEDHPNAPIIAHFADGSAAEADFLIGADGVHSAVREYVAPNSPRPVDSGLVGFGGFVPESSFEGPGPEADLVGTLGRSGFFGYGRCSPNADVMWWSTLPAPRGLDAAMFRAMSQETIRSFLARFHAGWHSPIPGILAAARNIIVTAEPEFGPLPCWSRGRALVIGDAAHPTSPHAGQGASLALEDAMVLARLLAKKRDVTEVFYHFERDRRPRTDRIVALARRNGNSKREFSGATAWLRDRMLGLLMPVAARSMDFMYAYDACAAVSGIDAKDAA